MAEEEKEQITEDVFTSGDKEVEPEPAEEVQAKPKTTRRVTRKKTEATYTGTGRRKKSVARVRLVPGDGSFIMNDRPLDVYFAPEAWQLEIKKPLRVTQTLGKYNVVAKLHGGGMAGQMGALRHGVARALLEVSDDFREDLKKAGLLTRDSRMKERKKYGLKKARKAPQFSKR